VLDAKPFDTHGDGSAGDKLKDFLNGIQGKYVTVGCLPYLYCFTELTVLVAFQRYSM